MATAVQRVGKLGRLLQARASSGPGIKSTTARNNTVITARNMASFYDIKAKTLDGRVVSMSDFKGKAVLIENTASL